MPLVDATVNYNPFYIWSTLPSSRPNGLEWVSPESWLIEHTEDTISIELSYTDLGAVQLSISIDADGRFKLMLESPSNDKLAYLRVVKTVNETEGFMDWEKYLTT